MRMPFGKYKHRDIAEIPTDYLRWLWHECRLDRWQKLAIERELDRRFGVGEQDDQEPDDPGDDCPRCSRLRAVLKSAFGKAALRLHPDRGGSTEAMQVLNDLHECLEEALRN